MMRTYEFGGERALAKWLSLPAINQWVPAIEHLMLPIDQWVLGIERSVVGNNQRVFAEGGRLPGTVYRVETHVSRRKQTIGCPPARNVPVHHSMRFCFAAPPR